MLFAREYRMPATLSAIQPIGRAARKPPGAPAAWAELAIGLILAFGIFASAARSDDPPPNLAKLVAHHESETEAERNEYMYRQTVTLEELDDHGGARGLYREIRDIIF